MKYFAITAIVLFAFPLFASNTKWIEENPNSLSAQCYDHCNNWVQKTYGDALWEFLKSKDSYKYYSCTESCTEIYKIELPKGRHE